MRRDVSESATNQTQLGVPFATLSARWGHNECESIAFHRLWSQASESQPSTGYYRVTYATDSYTTNGRVTGVRSLTSKSCPVLLEVSEALTTLKAPRPFVPPITTERPAVFGLDGAIYSVAFEMAGYVGETRDYKAKLNFSSWADQNPSVSSYWRNQIPKIRACLAN